MTVQFNWSMEVCCCSMVFFVQVSWQNFYKIHQIFYGWKIKKKYYKKVKTKQSIAIFFHFSTFQRICVRVPRDLRNCQKFTRITFDFMSNFDRCEVSLSTGPGKKKIHCDDRNFGKFSFSFVTFVSIHTLIEDKVCASKLRKVLHK